MRQNSVVGACTVVFVLAFAASPVPKSTDSIELPSPRGGRHSHELLLVFRGADCAVSHATFSQLAALGQRSGLPVAAIQLDAPSSVADGARVREAFGTHIRIRGDADSTWTRALRLTKLRPSLLVEYRHGRAVAIVAIREESSTLRLPSELARGHARDPF